MNVVLNRSAVGEFGVYRQAGVIVLGFKFPTGAPIGSLIVQMEEETSSLARDGLGMYAEIDGNGFYGGVLEFEYDEVKECIRMALSPAKHMGISLLQVEVPQTIAADERQLIRKLATAYLRRNHPTSRKP
jgi:hypothetical protein